MDKRVQSDKRRPKGKQVVVMFLAGAFVFALGWGFGTGRVGLGATDSAKSSNSELPADLTYQDIETVYDTLKANYDGELTLEKIKDGLKKGLAEASGDPYTEYLSAEESQEFDEELAGSFTGIGAELSKENDVVTVVAPIAGYPAEKAGLRAKDVIVEIDGKTTNDLSITEAVKRIRGPKGTVVKITVVRDKSQELTFDIQRDNINIPSVEYEIKPNNIGYMKISRFGDDTARLARQAAEEFKQKNVRGVVVDVRNNPGGLLDSSVDVAGLWLNQKTVLTERRGDVTVKTYSTENGAPLNGIPTVVLINEGSASASEILAGALSDNKAATLVGAKSFGKGSVQRLNSLRDGGTLKVTIARWYTPSGKNIDKEGIKPDSEVKFSPEDFVAKKDPQLDAALKSLQQ